MSNAEESGFLAALEEAPGDDTTWLVYADWLEERGDPRGAHLRLTADLARGAVAADEQVAAGERLWEQAASLPAAWTRRIAELRAARPLRYRVLSAQEQGGDEPATWVQGLLEAGTIHGSDGVAVPLAGGGVAHVWVRQLVGVEPPQRWLAGQVPLKLPLLLPALGSPVAEGGVLVGAPEGSAELQRRLNLALHQLELSIRATNCLESEGITSVRDLVIRTEDELLGVRNFGETTLREVRGKLAGLGLSLGMRRPPVVHEPPPEGSPWFFASPEEDEGSRSG